MLPRNSHRVKKILFFALSFLLFGVLYSLLEKGLLGDLTYYPSTDNVYKFEVSIIVIPLGSLLLGIFIAFIELFFFNQLFKKKSFGKKLVFKVTAYIVLILIFLFFLTLIGNSNYLNKALFDEAVIQSVIAFFQSIAFLSVILYVTVIIFLTIFIAEINDNLGMGVLRNFFLGKYHKAIVEERIFMFLDMKSSTSIAEKLGHVLYYQLLNDYYSDMSKAIQDSYGQIYQYVGDEVVVSWKYDMGLDHSNCINCLYLAKEIFRNKSPFYLEKYGLTPDFKAGFHLGSVSSGEVGIIKKEIIFTGDVLNTTARIQALCNELNFDLLLSQELASQLELSDNYEVKSVGEFELRGRKEKIVLMTIDKIIGLLTKDSNVFSVEQ